MPISDLKIGGTAPYRHKNDTSKAESTTNCTTKSFYFDKNTISPNMVERIGDIFPPGRVCRSQPLIGRCLLWMLVTAKSDWLKPERACLLEPIRNRGRRAMCLPPCKTVRFGWRLRSSATPEFQVPGNVRGGFSVLWIGLLMGFLTQRKASVWARHDDS